MIKFCKLADPYGCFSNFSKHPLVIIDREFPTSEHAFQAMKFYPHRPDLVEMIRKAATPKIAADTGRNRAYPLRVDWETPIDPFTKNLLYPSGQPDDGVVRPQPPEPIFTRGKDGLMYDVLECKFAQNPDALKVLLSTGTDSIVEDSAKESYWAWGPDKLGQNKLGRLLMALRGEFILAQTPASSP